MKNREFWGAILASIITVGVPALVWGGSISARVETLAQQQNDSRKEAREDLREINRKLDSLMQAAKLKD